MNLKRIDDQIEICINNCVKLNKTVVRTFNVSSNNVKSYLKNLCRMLLNPADVTFNKICSFVTRKKKSL